MMLDDLSILAQSMFPWYNWVFLAAIIAIVIGYKMWKNKTMT